MLEERQFCVDKCMRTDKIIKPYQSLEYRLSESEVNDSSHSSILCKNRRRFPRLPLAALMLINCQCSSTEHMLQTPKQANQMPTLYLSLYTALSQVSEQDISSGMLHSYASLLYCLYISRANRINNHLCTQSKSMQFIQSCLLQYFKAGLVI